MALLKLKAKGIAKDELKKHLADLVEFDGLGYDEPKENTLKCAAETLFSECIEWDKRPKTVNEKFTEALQGLPSYISVPFYNYDIENLMKAFGYEYNDCLNTYWSLCGDILAESYLEDAEVIKY